MKISKKNLTIGALVGVVAIVAIIAYFIFRPAKTILNKKSLPVTSKPVTQANKQSLEDLLKKDTAKCIFSNNGIEGEVYIYNKSIRFNSKNTQRNTTDYLIFRDNVLHSWSEGYDYGVKLAIETGTDTGSKAREQLDKVMEPVYKNDLNCSTWVADESMFKEPDTVNYLDINDILDKLNK
ncbi:hypothetical protein COV24_00765 [candidate division WWE3 bacterium CG10_big_fil_rev_8_21_14_0_10_32_10]|uniref:Uncharacterized protein n=1 Tax=candidate division WWE3 bacterium CG10_big_fil_rev_8_21_14_0_10_32_10 TaxID=1975090 RepID=A0A2H0RBA7_UNCKA|nr:MAG: hypothetical protein COV24_00765 [candidate division WWE3 bacterium CG10_big_fil_rev_8_21_14_0_10_32_10]